jgi:hypothetical protein
MVTRVGGGFSNNSGAGGVASLALTYSPTASNTLCVTCKVAINTGTFAVGDVTVADNATGGSSTYVNPTAGFAGSGTTEAAWVFYCQSLKSGATTITMTVANHVATAVTSIDITVDEYSGVGLFDVAVANLQASATNATDNITSGSLTTTAGSDWLWSRCWNDTGTGVISVGTGLTLGFTPSPGTAWGGTEYKTCGAAGSYAATWTYTVTATRNITMAMAFKPSGVQTTQPLILTAGTFQTVTRTVG